MKLPVYLDYSATTPVDPRVAAKMIPWLTEHFGNPASRSHSYGWEAEKAVEEAREEVAALVGADAKEIIWTSGATESNNLAIKGAAHFYAGTKGKHIITVATEHKAVLDTVKELERQGFEATYLVPQENGLITIDQFKAALRPDTVVASVMAVNNEIGVIQPLAEIGEICREKGVMFHVDAAQATGKMPIDLSKLKVDLMSFCAHKTYGPKGIGALYVRRKPRVRLEAQMHGGGHERGMRSGTLPTHQCVGMGTAFDIARQEMATESNNLAIKGAAHFYSSRGKHLVTVKTEHKAVLDTMRELERQGFEVTYLDVQENGLLDLDKFKDALRKDTILVSVMLVNNEIGVIQDIPAIGAMCRERGIVFHVDGAQATGKVAIDMANSTIDLLSLASHKTYAVSYTHLTLPTSDLV